MIIVTQLQIAHHAKIYNKLMTFLTVFYTANILTDQRKPLKCLQGEQKLIHGPVAMSYEGRGRGRDNVRPDSTVIAVVVAAAVSPFVCREQIIA